MELSRRNFLGVSAGGFASFALHNRYGDLLAADERHLGRAKSVIVLWMDGGPSQLDTTADGVKFSEHLWRTAAHANHLAVLRTVTSGEQDHVRGGYLLHTGYKQSGMVLHP